MKGGYGPEPGDPVGMLLLAEFDYCGSLATLVLWGFGDGGDVGVAAEILP